MAIWRSRIRERSRKRCENQTSFRPIRPIGIPWSFEHTLKLKNEPDGDLPEPIRRELSVPRIYLRGIPHRRDIDDCVTSREDIEAAWSIRLPSEASIGLPGRTAERLDRSSVIGGEDRSTVPHRPPWSGISYQPRVAQPFNHGRTLHTIAGRTIEAFYGVYDNPDARQVYYPQDYPWRCTGRIFTYTTWPTPNWSWWGSGALVGPRHVLTAGHVAPWGSQSWAMLFVPAYWDGASIFGAGASFYVSDYRGWRTPAAARRTIPVCSGFTNRWEISSAGWAQEPTTAHGRAATIGY